LIGITSERNATSSSKNAIVSTKAKTIGASAVIATFAGAGPPGNAASMRSNVCITASSLGSDSVLGTPVFSDSAGNAITSSSVVATTADVFGRARTRSMEIRWGCPGMVVRSAASGAGVGRIEFRTAYAETHRVPLTLLIIDDHAAFRAGARALLEADGYRVVGEAGDGRAGLAAASALEPDVVLLDVRLPDMDGFRVADCLAARGCTAAVVVTSSSDDPLYPARAVSSGARGFVAKHDVCGAVLDRLLA